MSKRGELRRMLGKNVVLKYTPELEFAYDPSIERGMKILSLMDEIEADEARNSEEANRNASDSLS